MTWMPNKPKELLELSVYLGTRWEHYDVRNSKQFFFFCICHPHDIILQTLQKLENMTLHASFQSNYSCYVFHHTSLFPTHGVEFNNLLQTKIHLLWWLFFSYCGITRECKGPIPIYKTRDFLSFHSLFSTTLFTTKRASSYFMLLSYHPLH